jgi:hypothetical protein
MDLAPGEGGCEVWKGGAGEDPGKMNGLRSRLSSALQDALQVNGV